MRSPRAVKDVVTVCLLVQEVRGLRARTFGSQKLPLPTSYPLVLEIENLQSVILRGVGALRYTAILLKVSTDCRFYSQRPYTYWTRIAVNVSARVNATY